jgi:hypothetical protein
MIALLQVSLSQLFLAFDFLALFFGVLELFRKLVFDELHHFIGEGRRGFVLDGEALRDKVFHDGVATDINLASELKKFCS